MAKKIKRKYSTQLAIREQAQRYKRAEQARLDAEQEKKDAIEEIKRLRNMEMIYV